MDIGYGRVSTVDQHPEMQLDALKAAGCDRVYIDKASGAHARRPELDRALDALRPGDRLTVWKLDRLGRSLSHLIATVDRLHERGVEFRSLTEGLDTSSASGRLLFHVLGALAEFERSLILERTMAGLASAKARGRRGGRPRALKRTQREEALRLVRAGRSHAEVAELFGVSRSTISRLVAADLRERAKRASEAI